MGLSTTGVLSTHYLTFKDARYFVAKLVATDDTLCRSLLPDLYEPVLTGVGNRGLMLREFERVHDCAVVQEWRCELAGA